MYLLSLKKLVKMERAQGEIKQKSFLKVHFYGTFNLLMKKSFT